MWNLVSESWRQRDYPSLIFVGLIVAAASWCAALPISTTVQEAYLHRFHLRSRSFAGWAAQQLTPAMYNLENTYWFCERPLTNEQLEQVSSNFFASRVSATEDTLRPGWVDLDSSTPSGASGHDESDARVYVSMLNHFPTRTMTFVHSRAFLAQKRQGYFYYCSRYRDRELRTAFQLAPVSNSQLRVGRQEIK